MWCSLSCDCCNVVCTVVSAVLLCASLLRAFNHRILHGLLCAAAAGAPGSGPPPSAQGAEFRLLLVLKGVMSDVSTLCCNVV
jgi:hypothetical protein